jgi:hypothetical protein
MSTITTALYQQDFYGWVQHHIQLLQQGRLSEIDVNLLIEELESMAEHDRHELENHFIILIANLLKWEYQRKQLTELWQTWKGGSWRSSIIEQRKQISRQLRKRPSLKPYLTAAVKEVYSDAVDIAHQDTGLPTSTFPNECPYLLGQLLDENFYPESR